MNELINEWNLEAVLINIDVEFCVTNAYACYIPFEIWLYTLVSCMNTWSQCDVMTMSRQTGQLEGRKCGQAD